MINRDNLGVTVKVAMVKQNSLIEGMFSDADRAAITAWQIHTYGNFKRAHRMAIMNEPGEASRPAGHQAQARSGSAEAKKGKGKEKRGGSRQGKGAKGSSQQGRMTSMTYDPTFSGDWGSGRGSEQYPPWAGSSASTWWATDEHDSTGETSNSSSWRR